MSCSPGPQANIEVGNARDLGGNTTLRRGGGICRLFGTVGKRSYLLWPSYKNLSAKRRSFFSASPLRRTSASRNVPTASFESRAVEARSTMADVGVGSPKQTNGFHDNGNTLD